MQEKTKKIIIISICSTLFLMISLGVIYATDIISSKGELNDDGIIDYKEVEKLKSWLEDNRLYKQYSLFNRIINKLEEILDDNIITEYERIELEKLVTSINSSKMYSESTLALQILNGILDGIVCNQKVNQKEIDNQMALIVSLYQTALRGGSNSVQAFSYIQELVEKKEEKKTDLENAKEILVKIKEVANNDTNN